MDFPKEELLEKYVSIYEEYIAEYVPDFEVKDGASRYVRFNDAWRELNPFEKLLIPRLLNRKNTFPKKTSKKLPKNANPENYVILKYDCDGNLKVARIGENGVSDMAFVYVSKQLTIGYSLDYTSDGGIIHSLYNFEWYEYDDTDRLISAEIFRGCGSPKDDVVINSEYYEYDGDVLSHAWCFQDYQKYLNQMTLNMVSQLMPDRIFNPNQIEYTFERVPDGLEYTSNHYYRRSQTLTDKGHVSEDTLSHLAENGLRLV
ncbi:MAG: hypothetical protein K6F55_00655 [Eubacterium sp.]|nr:hypothetical protein [Eubacterium sp.]